MWPNPQETADLVTITEEILNGKLRFFCGENKNKSKLDEDMILVVEKNLLNKNISQIFRSSPTRGGM